MFEFNQLPEILKGALLKNIYLKNAQTPIFIFSTEQALYNYNYFINAFKDNVKIFFPVKTNNNHTLLDLLNKNGSHFEIASKGELETLKKINVNCDKVLFGNPVKIESHIKSAFKKNVNAYAVDCLNEVEKISKIAPKSNVYLRLEVNNIGAEWKLNKKFGIESKNAIQLIQQIIKNGLYPTGISFHVGWNNENIETWKKSLVLCKKLFSECVKNNIHLKFINIGGGFPAHNLNQYTLLDKISKEINPIIKEIKLKFNVEIYAEPGSFITANAGILVTKVFNIRKRNNQNWAFVDASICEGFYWIYSGIKYKTFAFPNPNHSIKLKKFIITGPTCDSQDVFSGNQLLPENISTKDFLLIYPAGAYNISSNEYNGFPFPKTRII
jgi:ornithine decarboxylase